ncbi:MAG: DUF72 domain-containing protein [Melioribacteraceae bacterium]|nr:DUF72 domain-containing protein [Melioribacteraceae bacterium]
MINNSPKLYIGTAGWSYEDWVPSFYPFAQSKDLSWLQYYSRFFNVVEVNSTYYTYLSPKIAENWMRQLDDNKEFLFTIKLHQDFTHKRSFGDEQIKNVNLILDILKRSDRLGGLLLQFPYSFECNDASIDYIRRLIDIFDACEKFVEVRHNSWQNKNTKTITLCTIDQPQIGQSLEFKPIVGNDTVYLRFHGRNEKAWKKSINSFGKKMTYSERSARYEYLYSIGELYEIDQKIKEIYDKVKKVFVIMNNHPHGDAVANAFELLHLLKNREKINLPGTIIKSYPRLKGIASNKLKL